MLELVDTVPRIAVRALGQRPAGLLYDNNHAMIVLNRDLVDSQEEDIAKFYYEELGHMVNWWRCKIFEVDISHCAVQGDAGARFRDAVLVETSLHQTSFENLLTHLPSHEAVDRVAVKFANNTFAELEGWPNYYTINDHIAAGGKFNFLMRLGLDVTSEELQFISDEIDLEIAISTPSPAMKGNPWKQSENGYCQTDEQTDCNMPTMWVSVAFRDAIKMSVAKLPQVKNSQFSKTGFDLSPRLVRKHAGKLPFQLQSVKSTQWKYHSDFNIYAKKFTAGLESKLDLWKMSHAIAKKSPSKIHKPEIALKATPASGSYLVEIATRDKTDFAGWLAADITSNVAGCAAGFAIGVVTEEDPVLLCHGVSEMAEAVETAFQALDKKPTLLFEADSNVTLPVSLEYKYATSGEKLWGNSQPGHTGYQSGRVLYHRDSDTVISVDEDSTTGLVTQTRHPQISQLKSKVSRSMSKLAKSTLSPVAVFRFRIGFDYGEKIMQAGEYELPSAIVED